GMSLDDIVSTNPKLDEQKKLYMGELHQIMFKATVAIENAQNAARETEGAKFEKTKEKFIEDAIEEREKKRAKEFAAKNPPLNEQEARKALPPLTAKELEIRDKDIADDFRIEKGKVCIEAAKIAKENTMKTSEDVIAFKNVYLDMGVALSNQEFPAKPISDLHASAKNIEKVGLLKSMSLNYTDMLGKFGSDHGLDAEKTEKTKNAASVIDRSTFAALSCINFAAGDDFTNAANPNPGTMLHVRTSQEMFKELDAVTKGKEKFSDVEPGTGKKLMDKTFQLETGMEKKLFKPNSFDLKDPSGELSKNIEVFSPPKESVKVKENSASNVRK
ncbi:MAG: hypothetical protein FWD19_04475, partial [Defluviitaleaceae bacterium]|nr:hypothetical protein [Defluviitaleaceae bacterium]